MRKYAVLMLMTLVVGFLLARSGGSTRHSTQPLSRAISEPETTLTLAIDETGLTPAASVVSNGTRVHLEIIGRGRRAVRMSLSGYQDRVALAIAPGETARVVFTTDRPGQDFAWLMDSVPVGRVEVTGSHLVEGHR